jgi:hypothetical protein
MMATTVKMKSDPKYWEMMNKGSENFMGQAQFAIQ